MLTTICHCDACGQVIENPQHTILRYPRVQARRWRPSSVVWVEIDLCTACQRGLAAVATALEAAQRAQNHNKDKHHD